jgi:putative DNA methylase
MATRRELSTIREVKDDPRPVLHVRETARVQRHDALPIDTTFPEAQASLLSAREAFNKHLFRPNTYLHKWWARRSGTCFRHILKALVETPDARDFYVPGGLEGKIILDPMMGGGTTLHEALRMGASVIGDDIDPIPVVQARAALSSMPMSVKESAFEEFFRSLRTELSDQYLTTCPCCGQQVEIQFVLHGRKKRCSCGDAAIIDSFVLRENNGMPPVTLCAACGNVAAPACCAEPSRRIRVFSKEVTRCPTCCQPFTEHTELVFPDRFLPIAVCGICPRDGQFFKSPDECDLEVMAASPALSLSVRLPPRCFAVPSGPKSGDLRRLGVKFYWELFTGRQLLYIKTAAALLRELSPELRDILGMLVSTSLDFNSLLCGYKGAGMRRPGAVRHVFAHHAYSIPYTALENNPLSLDASSGTLLRLFRDRILRGTRWALEPKELRLNVGSAETVLLSGESDAGLLCKDYDELRTTRKGMLLIQGDAGKLPLPDDSVDHVVTDPPYFDNVQYSDLSHFFRVWLGYLLPRRARWSYSPSLSAVAGDNRTVGRSYAAMMASVWSECRRVLRANGRLVFTFHHWRPDAWAALTISLRRAGARLINRYVVDSENPTSVHIANLRAIRHDCILVLAFPRSLYGTSRWKNLERVNTSDSEEFCRDCGEVLGSLLERGSSESEVEAKWATLLRETRTSASSSVELERINGRRAGLAEEICR